MKNRQNLIIICVIAVLITAIISLDCGITVYRAHSEGADSAGFGALARRVLTGTADYLIMIDPGHGGMDGGASASDGTLEKDINLAIAKRLADEAEQYDCRAMLTRETDEWLCDTDEGSIRSRKTADLIARRDLIRKYAPDVTVSIHLNSFKEDPGVRGAQVFYPTAGGSQEQLQECRRLAETLQQSLNETLQPEDPRTAMTRDGVFIFKEVEQPVVIVECGFMSNREEAGKLSTDEYQRALAQCIMAGVAEFAGLEKPETVEIVDSSR